MSQELWGKGSMGLYYGGEMACEALAGVGQFRGKHCWRFVVSCDALGGLVTC